MKFPFNERKAAQAAAHLLSKRGGSLDYGCLIKLLYLADRQGLVAEGLPITGDTMWLLEHGPVLEAVKDCMNGRPPHGAAWQACVSERDDDNRVYLTCAEPPIDELSDHEVGILDAVDAEHGGKTWKELVKFCHSLPEWEKVARGNRRPLLPERILWAAKVPRERIDRIDAQAALLMRAVEIGGSGL